MNVTDVSKNNKNSAFNDQINLLKIYNELNNNNIFIITCMQRVSEYY